MSRSIGNIILITVCIFLCPILHVAAQEKTSGTITIHSDARLAILLKKGHLIASASPISHTAETIVKPNVAEPVIIHPTSAPSTAIIHHTAEVAPSQQLLHRDVRTLYKGKGFRVQIYNGPDRDKAMSIKTEFMRHFPGVHSYIIYSAPAFRVKIGDYRNRSDAEGMLREANSMFRPSMIVPDEVTISNL